MMNPLFIEAAVARRYEEVPDSISWLASTQAVRYWRYTNNALHDKVDA